MITIFDFDMPDDERFVYAGWMSEQEYLTMFSPDLVNAHLYAYFMDKNDLPNAKKHLHMIKDVDFRLDVEYQE